MPAKKKIAKKAAATKPAKPAAKKAPAKPVKKAASKPAPKAKAVKPAKAPVKKPVAKAPAKPAKAAVKSKSPTKKPAPKAAVKKAAPKAKATPKAAAKPSKQAPSKVKKAPPAAKSKSAPAKAAKPAAKESAKASPAPKAAAAPAPAPVKEQPAPKKKDEPKKGSKSSTPSVATPTKNFNAGPPIKSVSRTAPEEVGATIEAKKSVKMTPFLKKQKARLVELRSLLLDNMDSVAEGSLRTRPEGSEASAFGMHQADAGSDAYDRDFALSLLSQEQDSLYEINEALKRIDIGSYGICEMSGKPIPEVRLEALPFTRFTVECQAQLERDNMGGRFRRPVRSLFGLEDSADSDSDGDDDEETETVDKKEE